MLFQIIITSVLALFLANLMLNLKNLRKPSADSKAPEPAPLISVLIPARNEENNIRVCLESLQKQDYPNFEILVLDDNSDDMTGAIVTGMAVTDRRIHLISGQPLADGWTGKCYACYQLAQKAGGVYLLFVDADTIHEPHMLRSALALAMELKTSLLSGFNRQITDSFPLKIIMPVMYFIMLGWAPLWLLHRSKKPLPSVAIGQFLFFSTEEYWRIGGHEAVKSKVVEDIQMGIEVAKHGGRHIAVDLTPVVSCHMYHTVAGAWNGLGKSIYAVVAMAPLGLVALVGIASLFYFGPFYNLWYGFVVEYQPLSWRVLVILQIGIIYLMRWLIDSRFREAPWAMWFHPIGLAFYVFNVCWSGLRWLFGAPVSWKDRSYDKEHTEEESLPPGN
jgi:chlorobactene glucosyltransferase